MHPATSGGTGIERSPMPARGARRRRDLRSSPSSGPRARRSPWRRRARRGTGRWRTGRGFGAGRNMKSGGSDILGMLRTRTRIARTIGRTDGLPPRRLMRQGVDRGAIPTSLVEILGSSPEGRALRLSSGRSPCRRITRSRRAGNRTRGEGPWSRSCTTTRAKRRTSSPSAWGISSKSQGPYLTIGRSGKTSRGRAGSSLRPIPSLTIKDLERGKGFPRLCLSGVRAPSPSLPRRSAGGHRPEGLGWHRLLSPGRIMRLIQRRTRTLFIRARSDGTSSWIAYLYTCLYLLFPLLTQLFMTDTHQGLSDVDMHDISRGCCYAAGYSGFPDAIGPFRPRLHRTTSRLLNYTGPLTMYEAHISSADPDHAIAVPHDSVLPSSRCLPASPILLNSPSHVQQCTTRSGLSKKTSDGSLCAV